MVETEIKLFAIYFITGVLLSILFDIFRASRKNNKTSNIATCIQDIIFWLIAFIIIIIVMFKSNNFEIRFYLVIALVLGSILYYLTISKIVININTRVIKIIKNMFSIFKKIFLKIIGRPILFIFLNFKKILKKLK